MLTVTSDPTRNGRGGRRAWSRWDRWRLLRSRWPSLRGPLRRAVFARRRSQGKRHGAFDNHFSVDAGRALQETHATSEPQHPGFDLDDVAGVNRPAKPNAFDAHEINEALPVFRFRQD